MSEWTHSICEKCWIQQNSQWEPIGDWDGNERAEKLVGIRRPAIVLDTGIQTCCFCGNLTIMGAFVRADPAIVEFCNHDEVIDVKQNVEGISGGET